MYKFMKYAFWVGMAWSSVSCNPFDKDPCRKVECQNNGICNEGICECPTGYEGDRCQTPARDKMLGMYDVVYKVLTPSYFEYQGTMEVIANADNVQQMYIIARATGRSTDTLKVGWLDKTRFGVVALDTLHGYPAGRNFDYDFGRFAISAGSPLFEWHFCERLEIQAFGQ